MNATSASPTSKPAAQYRCELAAGESFASQLQRACALDAGQLAEALDKGAVWLQRRDRAEQLRKPIRIRALEERPQAGDVVLVNYDSQVLAQRAPAPKLVSDQRNYSIWNKPSGVFSQGSKWGDHCSITWLVERAHGVPTHLVHRLDRAANGLIVLAHTRNAQRRLASMFERREVGKFYRARVHGHFDCVLPHQLNLPIAGREALTSVLKGRYCESTDSSELCVQIATGRKHQIRLHLSGAGYPLIGDRRYDPDREHSVDLQLTACRLEFVCPFTDRPMQFDLT